MTDLEQLKRAVEAGDRVASVRLTSNAIAEGVPAPYILDTMTAALQVVGRQFQDNEIFVPEMLISARAMKEAAALLEPLLAQSGMAPPSRAIIGTVRGDLHDIGKNLVAMMWKGANFDVVDLGVNVSPEQFAAAVDEYNPELVGISALLTTTMVGMKATVEAVRAVSPTVRIIVGGAPVTAEFARSIGADAYAPDAASAAQVAVELVGPPATPA